VANFWRTLQISNLGDDECSKFYNFNFSFSIFDKKMIFWQPKISGGGSCSAVVSPPPDHDVTDCTRCTHCRCTGVVYKPGEPLLLQSVGNSFVLRCIDGLHIDGNDRRISAAIYRSAADMTQWCCCVEATSVKKRSWICIAHRRKHASNVLSSLTRAACRTATVCSLQTQAGAAAS